MTKSRLLLIILLATLAIGCNDARKSGMKEIDDWAEGMAASRFDAYGYPCNQNIALKEFYEWYMANDLEETCMNNVGDPFVGSPFHQSCSKLEVDVLRYFGDLYDMDQDNLWGIVTNSGTDGNNHGLYFGYKYLEQKTGKKPVMYVSDEAHYSNMRLADVQNIDLRLIKSDAMGRMIPEEFEKALDTSRPCLLVYAMGSTFKGAIDDQDAINAVLDRYPDVAVYRHIDAALFGGYLPFTQYKDLVDWKRHPFNSIAVSGHKFFGMDEPCGVFLCTREVYDNQGTFDIAYLNQDMRMINCSRSTVAPLKFWWLIHKVGTEQWKKEAEAMLECTQYLKAELDRIGYPCWVNEYSNTIFFKRPSAEIVTRHSLAQSYDEKFGGELAHIVVMQHITHERIDRLVSDISAEMQNE